MHYLVAIHHPDDYDPAAAEDESMHRDIDLLNEERCARSSDGSPERVERTRTER